MILTIRNTKDLDQYYTAIEKSTTQAVEAIRKVESPSDALRTLKFEKVGFHPIDGRPLNFIEQVNQTFTFLTALKAASWLFDRHPEAGGFKLAPGAHAAQPLDVMSIVPDLVGAETFAATHPESNRKIFNDLAKLKLAKCKFRYAFFYSPNFPTGNVKKYEKDHGIEVHCLDI
ncbi:MAG: hypothetical protein KIT15_02380 [Xanthobacteraceae bacterium]|nr:hypothetical protein [Xanthobacteraceae bacterium]